MYSISTLTTLYISIQRYSALTVLSLDQILHVYNCRPHGQEVIYLYIDPSCPIPSELYGACKVGSCDYFQHYMTRLRGRVDERR